MANIFLKLPKVRLNSSEGLFKMLKFCMTNIEGVYVIEPQLFGDGRGYFMETYSDRDFEKMGLDYTFVQDNESHSTKGVLRGLHFQVKHPQAKLVRVTEGEVFDVVVDLRKGSKTYGKWYGVILSSENKKQLLIPRGFAHGFLVLSESATFCYKCDDFYYPDDEDGILWNDPIINIKWPYKNEPILSLKDKIYKTLNVSKIGF